MRNDSDHFAGLEQAWELYLEGKLQAALESAEAALEVDADSMEANHLVGNIKAAMGNPVEALAHFEAALEVDGLFFDALLSSGDVLIQVGRPELALQRLEVALEQAVEKEGVADSLLLMMDALFSLNRREDAARVLEQMPAGPFAPHIEFLIGRAAHHVGDYKRASVLLEGALASGIDDAEIHYSVALSRESLGDFRGAAFAFLECRERDIKAPVVPWGETTAQFERRLQDRIPQLPAALLAELEDTLIIVEAFPGVEMVAEGLNPRAPAMMDEVPLHDGKDTLRRLFVYHRNIDRFCAGPDSLDTDLDRILAAEIEAFLKAPRVA